VRGPPRMKRRRRLVLLALAMGVVAVSLGRTLGGGSLIVRPSDPCAERPPLVTWEGVTLQPVAMKAFRQAERRAHGDISVVQSYRSCHQQAAACRNICGNAEGCPGRCAKPGSSYHQLGAAVDITQGSLDTAGVIDALRGTGWCQSQPSSDPGHFSFDGCH
jgi:D-alanyl-D-alanine carboxypeptidase-like protein